MIEIGQVVSLKSVKSTPQGVYLLTSENLEVLLPHKYVPKKHSNWRQYRGVYLHRFGRQTYCYYPYP